MLQREDGYFECMAWEDDKADLVENNPFAALPFIIDGETVVATAPASSDYLAHKLGLAGGDEVARNRNQQALAVSYELRSDALRVLYAPTEVYEMGHRGHLERTVRMHYAKLDQWLKMHGTAYLSADAPASADFELWEMLDMHELWANDVGCTRPLTSFQHLTKIYESMRLLPELQPYFRGPAFGLPFNNKMARFRQTNSSKNDALSAPGTNVRQERVFLGTLIDLYMSPTQHGSASQVLATTATTLLSLLPERHPDSWRMHQGRRAQTRRRTQYVQLIVFKKKETRAWCINSLRSCVLQMRLRFTLPTARLLFAASSSPPSSAWREDEGGSTRGREVAREGGREGHAVTITSHVLARS